MAEGEKRIPKKKPGGRAGSKKRRRPVTFCLRVALYYVAMPANVFLVSRAFELPLHRERWMALAAVSLLFPLRPRIGGLDRRCMWGFFGAVVGFGLGLVLLPVFGSSSPSRLRALLASPPVASQICGLLAILFTRWRIERKKGGRAKTLVMFRFWRDLLIDVSFVIVFMWGAGFVRSWRIETARKGAEKRREVMASVIQGDLERVKEMLEDDPGLLREKNGRGGLRNMALAAASTGKRDTLDYLVGLGAEVDVFVAARLGDPELLRAELDENPAALEARDRGGWTPLMLAARYDRAGAVRLLTERGVDLYLEGPEGTALHVAILADSFEVLELLAANSDFSRRARRKAGPFFFAMVEDKRSAAEILLKHGADVNARDAQAGTRPLHYAARKGRSDMMEFLLAHGADVNATDDAGFTPLHVAVYQGRSGSVRLLLERGAKPNARDRRGRTPLAVAGRGVKPEIAEMMRAAGAQ